VTEGSRSDVDPTTLADLLFDTLTALLGAIRRENSDRLAFGDTTWSQNAILAVLVNNGPMRLGELASLERRTPASTTITTMRMQRAGLLRRVPDRTDRRAVAVEVAPKGVAAYLCSVLNTRTKWYDRRAGGSRTIAGPTSTVPGVSGCPRRQHTTLVTPGWWMTCWGALSSCAERACTTMVT
jgi:DNA-binding MarR family transcriptional regulator